MGTITSKVAPESNLLPSKRMIANEILKKIHELPYGEEKKQRRTEYVIKNFLGQLDVENKGPLDSFNLLSELTGLGLTQVTVSFDDNPIKKINFRLGGKDFEVEINYQTSDVAS